MADTLINRALESFDIEQTLAIRINASADRAFEALLDYDPHQDSVLHTVFTLHDAPAMLRSGGAQRARSLSRPGPLRTWAMATRKPAARSDGELLLGFVGKFWWPPAAIEMPDLKNFRDAHPRDVTKVVWSFALPPTELVCTLRAKSTTRRARLAFGAYWRLVSRASAAVRLRLLNQVKVAAET